MSYPREHLIRGINSIWIWSNLDVGKIADYIVDVMVIRKRLIKSHEIDYSTIHLEKSSDEDSKKVVDRTLKKLK